MRKVKQKYSFNACLGIEYRNKAAQSWNSHSSRSHAIFIIDLTKEWREENQIKKRTASFYLVDLAGSEKYNPESQEEQKTENKHINT
jgi:hypothetical protein